MLKRYLLAVLAVFGYTATAAAQQVDPNVPVNIPVQDLTNYPGMLDQVLADILTPATPPLLGFGNDLWSGLAVIVVVWTGLRIAYSGSFNGWELIRLFIGLWIPWAMLLFYDTPIPGTTFTFPMTISAGGNWLASTFSSDVVDLMFSQTAQLVSNYTASLSAAWNIGSVWGMLTSGTSALFTLVGTAAIIPLFILALLLIFAVAYAQVIWATIAISMATFADRPPSYTFASRDGETIESLPKRMVSIDRRQTSGWRLNGFVERFRASGGRFSLSGQRNVESAKLRNPAPSSHRRRAAGASGRSGAEGTSLSNHDLHGVKVGYEISFTLDRLAHLAGEKGTPIMYVEWRQRRTARDGQGKPLLDEEGRPKARMGRARPAARRGGPGVGGLRARRSGDARKRRPDRARGRRPGLLPPGG